MLQAGHRLNSSGCVGAFFRANAVRPQCAHLLVSIESHEDLLLLRRRKLAGSLLSLYTTEQGAATIGAE